MDANPRQARQQLGVLSGLMLSDPKMKVSLELVDNMIIATSLVDPRRVVIPKDRLSPPGMGPTGDLAFAIEGVVDGWAHLLVESPVADVWDGLADERRAAYRRANETRVSTEATDAVVTDASSVAKRVWYVLPPPMEGFDLGVSIADIGWQTGLDDGSIFDALNELDIRGILDYNAKGEPRRKARGGG